MRGEKMMKIRSKRILIMSIAITILFGIIPFDRISMAADTTNPEISHAYIEDGVLKLRVSFDRILAKEAIIYTIGKEVRSYEIHRDDYTSEYDDDGKWKGRVYEIHVDIPSDIFITIKDINSNESTYKFSIKEDNAPLTSSVPEYIMERLSRNRQSTVNRFKGYDDILELEYGKVVDAFSLYDNIIRDNYYRYHKADIRFKASGLSIDRDGNIKLNKYGIFKITMTHNLDKTFEESAYVLIRPNWRNTEKRESPSNFSPYIVYKDKIKLADYFRYEDEVGSKKGKIDTTYMLVHDEETNKTLGMNEQISLDLNVPYKLSVLNFEDNSQQDFYVMRQEKAKSTNRNFTDLDKEHWASKEIGSLVSKGILSGYPDGTFKPGGNITVKEFMTILSREIAINPTKGRPIVGDVVTPIKHDTWGFIESKSVLDRIPTKYLYKFNYLDMDRDINREEVAFIINNIFMLERPYITNKGKPISDIARSPHKKDINELVDLGIISGYPNGTFKPKDNITRAEIAALITRIK